MVYDFEEKTSNIEEYINKIVVVQDVRVDVGEGLNITELTLDSGEILSTTSNVIQKQAVKLKEQGNLPFRAKIIVKKGKGGFNYYTFKEPKKK